MPIVKVQLHGFSPDLDPDTVGIMVSSDNIYPTPKGFAPFPSLVEAYPVLPTVSSEQQAALGAYFATYLDATSRIVVGTQKRLYVATGSGWVDLSGGATYSATTEDRWRFAQFGNDTIAVNGRDLPQVASNSSASFADLGGSPPRAKLIATTRQFVLLANTSTDSSEWACSAIGVDDDWAPATSTQAMRASISDAPGEITALHRLRDGAVFYKRRSMHLARYLGDGGITFAVELVSDNAGAVSNEAVVSMGDLHVFMGEDNFYRYDGAGAPTALAAPLRRYLFDDGDLDQNYAYKVIGRWDRAREVVVWHYPSTRSGTEGLIDSWVAWSPITNEWTQGALQLECVVLPEITVYPGLTYDELGTLFSTYADMNTQRYDSVALTGSEKMLQGIFKTDHKMYMYTGDVVSGEFRTGRLGTGDNLNFSLLQSIRPRFARFPETGGFKVAGYTTDLSGKTETLRGEAPLNMKTGRINLRQSGRFHSFDVSMTSDCEITAMDIEATPAGVR